MSFQPFTVKYIIRAKFQVEGVVEKPDVIGAVFGQTEGLFGTELDLRELQKSGRIGRIEIDLKSEKDKTEGSIIIPTSLDRVSTAIIAASVESIDRIGPCQAKVDLVRIEDVREIKRKAIIERAKEILHNWNLEKRPETEEIFREVSEILKATKVETYGPEKLSAGPDVASSKEIIIVEGRADIVNLLKMGIQNTIALEGVKVPETIIKLTKEKEATAFLDGDHGGDLILKELLQVANVKYVARAPPGKEVEDLTAKEVEVALKNRIPIEEIKGKKKKRKKVLVPKEIIEAANELKGTLEAILLDDKMNKIGRIPVSELAEKLREVEGVNTVVFDGVTTQRLIDIASEKNIKYLVAARVSDVIKQPLNVNLLTFNEVLE
ncbi:MAG: DNA primase DnaG [Candidatus Bathyarchaeia archaeon]|nr:DNA primase [Candidatus Bathyarchaeota archaeon]